MKNEEIKNIGKRIRFSRGIQRVVPIHAWVALVSLSTLLWSCGKKDADSTVSTVVTLQDSPSFEILYEKKDQDSIRFHTIIDSLWHFTTQDSSLIPFLDQCYWEFHRRRLKIVPIYNKRGFSTTEADKKTEWLFEKKTVNCNEMGIRQLEFNKIEIVDSTCEFCFFLEINPFDNPIQYVTLNKKNELVFTESYARSYLLGLPRLVKKYRLDYLDQKEIRHILNSFSGLSPVDSSIGLDGVSIFLDAAIMGRKTEVSRWCHPKELSELWRFIETKMKVKLSRC